jgi:outer membrane immunogenic protein
MRHFLLASVSILALDLWGPARAADLPTKAKPPAPVALSDWTGFYLGVHGGYGWQNNPFTAPVNGEITIGGINSRGGLVGGHAGHNWQYDRVVGGLEIDFSATDIEGSTSVTIGDPGDSTTLTLRDRVGYLGSARARLGFLPFDSVLLYGTGGLAWERLKRTRDTRVENGGDLILVTETEPRDRFGWTAGAGVETKLFGNWLGRVEYLHYDFGTSPIVVGDSTSGRQTIDVLRAALSYRFGSPSTAAAAPRLVKAAPAAIWSWAGFYLGIHGGYGWGNNPFSEPVTFSDPIVTIGGIHSDGWLVGGHAGHNWQYGNVVTGVEVDLSATDIRGSTSATLPDPATVTRGDHVEYLGTLRARLGMLPTDGVLLYGTAGLAWERLQQIDTFANEFGSGAGRTPIDRFGWVAGAGVEARLFGSNWLGRIEYLHYDFGRMATSLDIRPTESVDTRGTASNQTVDVIRAGLSYKFGPSPGSASAAMAAALPVKAAPVAPWSWSGFYLGAHGGYGWHRNPLGQTFVRDLDTNPDVDDFQSASLGTISAHGWLFGGHAGYNWQHHQLVIGTEFDFTAADIDGSTSAVLFRDFGGGFATRTIVRTLQDRVKYFGSARARLGVLPTDSVLLYGTAGLGWERLERTDTETDTFLFGVTIQNAFSTTQPVDRFGWVAGGGTEARLFGSNWLGRVEYLHYDFGSFATSSTTDVVGGVATVSRAETSGRQTIDVVRAGVSYKFGQP